ncbi:integrase [Streptomyces sp. WAC 06783]|nr:tyrosine-type recombinase/integrase [Streptomyces sp. WAC 06783]RSO13494.1 integrase [Streptomyces sp. WAC 06783]
MSPRRPNMESSIYLGSDGWWHGRVTMGVKNDGSPDRRHRRAKTEAAVRRKVKELEKLRDEGRAPKAGRIPTVEQWMETYLNTIAIRTIKPRTWDDYWSKTRNDINPHIGKHRLDRLRPEHLDQLYTDLLAQGHAPSHVLKVHRTLSRALKIAHRRELIGRNVATLVDAPSVEETEANPFTQEQAKDFLKTAAKRRTALRWGFGIGLAVRQGETLGLRWSYLDLDTGECRTEWQLQRLTWRHGCADPHACGSRRHRFDACPTDCTRHRSYKRGCPKPCAKNCTKHASTCPERKGGGLVFTRPKTKKSQRPLVIPPPLIPLLREHKARQEIERAEAGDAWEENDLVFARPDGRPIDPRDDWEEFKEILAEAGISDRRLYDGSRHTGGTILNELGVGMRTIMEIMRHTHLSTTRRYVKSTDPLAQEAARRIGEALWPQAGKTETRTETTSTKDAQARRRRRIK